MFITIMTIIFIITILVIFMPLIVQLLKESQGDTDKILIALFFFIVFVVIPIYKLLTGDADNYDYY